MMQVAKKVPFEDPNVLNAVRGLYLLSNIIIAAFYAYIKVQIDKKKGESQSTRPLPPFHQVFRRPVHGCAHTCMPQIYPSAAN